MTAGTLSVADLRPPVVLGASDHRRLVAAALGWLLRAPRLAGGLLDEVDRACVLPDEAVGPQVARLGSWVDFVEAGGPVRRGQLALASDGEDALSVLSPAGAALIGLSAGATIRWPDRLGAERRITLLRVTRP